MHGHHTQLRYLLKTYRRCTSISSTLKLRGRNVKKEAGFRVQINQQNARHSYKTDHYFKNESLVNHRV